VKGTEYMARTQRNARLGDSEAISISIPAELHQTINGIMVRDNKSRSLVITELIRKGLEAQ